MTTFILSNLNFSDTKVIIFQYNVSSHSHQLPSPVLPELPFGNLYDDTFPALPPFLILILQLGQLILKSILNFYCLGVPPILLPFKDPRHSSVEVQSVISGLVNDTAAVAEHTTRASYNANELTKVLNALDEAKKVELTSS